MLIIKPNDDLTSSSDEDPDHRRLSPWFDNLLRITKNIIKLPDHGSFVQLSNLPQFYLKNDIQRQSDNILCLSRRQYGSKLNWTRTSIQITWLNYRWNFFARFYHGLFSID